MEPLGADPYAPRRPQRRFTTAGVRSSRRSRRSICASDLALSGHVGVDRVVELTLHTAANRGDCGIARGQLQRRDDGD